MELSPQKVRSMSFTTTKRGYDKAEVDTFVAEVAAALENAQNETTAMEARARAAIARLKEVTEQGGTSPVADDGAGVAPVVPADEPAAVPATASLDDAETISRTLLLAQRTADSTVADATAQAEQTVNEAREQADQMIANARVEARAALEEDRQKAQAEVDHLRGRRQLLESDVEHLEEFLIGQRDRLRNAAATLVDVAERVPDGLGHLRAPQLPADDEPSYEDEADVDGVESAAAAADADTAAMGDDDDAPILDEDDTDDDLIIDDTDAPTLALGDDADDTSREGQR